jgi:hypothetical protein
MMLIISSADFTEAFVSSLRGKNKSAIFLYIYQLHRNFEMRLVIDPSLVKVSTYRIVNNQRVNLQHQNTTKTIVAYNNETEKRKRLGGLKGLLKRFKNSGT